MGREPRHNTVQPTTDASDSAKSVMSDITKPKAKDLAQLRQELQIPDEKELLQIKKGEARGRTGTLAYEALQLEGPLGTQEEGCRPAAAARRRHARQLSHRRFVGEG